MGRTGSLAQADGVFAGLRTQLTELRQSLREIAERR